MGICNSTNETVETDCASPLGKCHIGRCRLACLSKCCRPKTKEELLQQIERLQQQIHADHERERKRLQTT